MPSLEETLLTGLCTSSVGIWALLVILKKYQTRDGHPASPDLFCSHTTSPSLSKIQRTRAERHPAKSRWDGPPAISCSASPLTSLSKQEIRLSWQDVRITNQTRLIFQEFTSCPLNNLPLNSASNLKAEVMDAKPVGLWFLKFKIPTKPS